MTQLSKKKKKKRKRKEKNNKKTPIFGSLRFPVFTSHGLPLLVRSLTDDAEPQRVEAGVFHSWVLECVFSGTFYITSSTAAFTALFRPGVPDVDSISRVAALNSSTSRPTLLVDGLWGITLATHH